MFMNVSVLPSQDLWVLCFNRIYETGIQFESDWIMTFYILRHQTVQYPTVKDNADLEFLSTPLCKVRNSSYEFAVLSKNKIPRDFWETQSLKNGLNRRFWKKIARLWLRHLRFESLYLCQYLGTFVFRGFLCPDTAFYGGIRAFFLCLKISWESLRDSERQQISKFQSHFSAI